MDYSIGHSQKHNWMVNIPVRRIYSLKQLGKRSGKIKVGKQRKPGYRPKFWTQLPKSFLDRRPFLPKYWLFLYGAFVSRALIIEKKHSLNQKKSSLKHPPLSFHAFQYPEFFLQIIASVQVDSIETNGTISNKLQSYILGNATIEGGTSIAKGTLS